MAIKPLITLSSLLITVSLLGVSCFKTPVAIKILTPAATDTWIAGEQGVIKWFGANQAALFLHDAAGTTVATIPNTIYNLSNTVALNYQIPANLKSGTYQWCVTPTGSIQQYCGANFKIVN
ncbi:MAG: hypothetical protein WCW27_02795 [Patescibacteria group bacterium]|jgi:hypothetical protein